MTAGSVVSMVPVVCIAGPTAAGKSRVAAALADALASTRPIEIVSVDSAQVFRGMDIGTAKPSAAERAALPHHLIDVIDPAEAYSAARFVAEARACIADIAERGRQPVLVGGTLLYFKALFDGLDALPPADPALRAALDAEAAERGWPALHAELARVDPITAARLAPNDAQRVQRALEVWRATGTPLSSLHSGRFSGAGGADGPGAARPAPPRTLLIALEPADRAWLHARIGTRFAAMLDAGLVDEVRALRARGDLRPTLASMRCVGYRQVWQMIDGIDALDGLDALDKTDTSAAGANAAAGADRAPDRARLLELGSAATRQLAKRQLTWLRSMAWRQVVACDAPDVERRAIDLVRRHLAEHAA